LHLAFHHINKPNIAPAGKQMIAEMNMLLMYFGIVSGFPIVKCGMIGPTIAKKRNIKPPQ